MGSALSDDLAGLALRAREGGGWSGGSGIDWMGWKEKLLGEKSTPNSPSVLSWRPVGSLRLGSGFETTPHRRVLWLRRVPTLQSLSFPPVCEPRRLCRSGGLVGTGRGAAGAVPRATRAGSPGSCGHVRDLGGGAEFRARKPRGRQHCTRRRR